MHVKRIRLGKILGIAIRSTGACYYSLSCLHGFAANFTILSGKTHQDFDRTIIAQYFSDSRSEQGWIVFELLKLLRMLEKSKQAIANRMNNRFLSHDKQESIVDKQILFMKKATLQNPFLLLR